MKRAPTLDLEEVLANLIAEGARPAGPSEPGDGATAALLSAAVELLAEHGARHWTMEDVAERAGVGRATVYRRFTSRDDLMRAAVTVEAQRFFAAIAESVRDVGPLEEKVVRGFLTGVRLALESPLGSLLRRDPAASLSLIASESLLRAATTALAERYETMMGSALSGPARARAEVSAEALVRLGLSFVLIPGVAVAPGTDRGALDHLDAIIRPLVLGRSSPAG